MTDQELIQALKVWRRNYYLTVEHDNLLMDVISALAALQAENAELRTQHRTEHCEASGYDCEELGKLRALGTVEELSALVKARDEGRVLPEKSMWTTTCKGRKLVLVMDVKAAQEAEAAIGGGGDG